MQPVSEESNLRECPSVQMQSHDQDLCLRLWPTCPLCSTEYDALPVLSSRGRTFRLIAPLSFCIWKSAWRKRCQHLFTFWTGKSTTWQMWCYCSTLPFCVEKPNTQQMFPQQIVQIHNKWVLHFSLCLRNSSTQQVCFIFFSLSLHQKSSDMNSNTQKLNFNIFFLALCIRKMCLHLFSLSTGTSQHEMLNIASCSGPLGCRKVSAASSINPTVIAFFPALAPVCMDTSHMKPEYITHETRMNSNFTHFWIQHYDHLAFTSSLLQNSYKL